MQLKRMWMGRALDAPFSVVEWVLGRNPAQWLGCAEATHYAFNAFPTQTCDSFAPFHELNASP